MDLILTVGRRQEAETGVLVLVEGAVALWVVVQLGMQVSLRVVERLVMVQIVICVLDVLLQLHFLMAASPSRMHRLHILRALRILDSGLRATLLLFLQFNHLLLRALELLQECGECFHDLLANRLKVVLPNVHRVDTVLARIADLETLAGILDPIDDLGQEIAF